LFGEVVTRGLNKTENDGLDSICLSTTIALFTLEATMLLESAKHSVLLDLERLLEHFESSKPLGEW